MCNQHIVLIGFNFQPKRSTGDKNFWVDIISLLAKSLQRITVISIRHNPEEYEEYNENGCHISILYCSPRFLETPNVKYKRPKIFWRKGAFPGWLGVIEKILDGRRICDKLKEIYEKNPYDHVHLMDNFGFVNRLIAGNTPTRVSVSAMAYQGKNKLIYDKYISFSYKHPNIKVVPYSLAYAKKLRQLGINNPIMCIKWGVKLSRSAPELGKRNKSKKLLPFSVNKPLFLWAGYIQQIQRKDFLLAIKIAKQALTKGINGIFYFAFKPESLEKNFISFNNPEKGIYVSATSVKEFSLLKASADIFFSPVANKNCILAPPLTWIEVLSYGVPILTTNVKGVEEIVIDGETGYKAINDDVLMEKIFTVADRYKNMISYCYNKAFNSYNIENTLNDYLNLWYKGDQ